jgi:hypothetical protein
MDQERDFPDVEKGVGLAMKNSITYGQLARKLQELGFSQRKVEYRGKPALVFIHKQDDTALIALPDVGPKETVSPDHLAMVDAVLKSHGIPSSNGEPVGW